VTPREIAADFFAALERRDLETLTSLVSDDIVEDVAGVGVITGRAAQRALLTAMFDSFPDLATEVTRIVGDGQVVAVEWRRRGTFSGLPWQGLPASGRPFAFRGVAIVEVDGDRVARVDVYADTAEFARDIGLLPARGSTGERLAAALFGARVRAQGLLRKGRA